MCLHHMCGLVCLCNFLNVSSCRCAMALSDPGNAVSQRSSTASDSYSRSAPSSVLVPEPLGEGCGACAPFRAECSTASYSLHVGSFIFRPFVNVVC